MKIHKYELVVVSGEGCVYCEMTKELLNSHKVPHRVVDYKTFPKFKEDKHMTIPQIYVYDRMVGEYDWREGGYQGLLETDMEGLKSQLDETEEVDIAF